MNLSKLLTLIGFDQSPINYRENLLSFIGGAIGIFFIFLTSFRLLDPQVAIYIIPSMGATAVLLFAAPNVPYAQPWNVVAGHIFSAIIGVACWQWLPNYIIAASASVGLAIGVMYLTRSIHPPGGATALAFVIGSDKLHDLGYFYVIHPVLVNTIAILIVAIIFNNLFQSRCYPASLNASQRPIKPVIPRQKQNTSISQEDFIYALNQANNVDVSESDLLKIYALAYKKSLSKSNTK